MTGAKDARIAELENALKAVRLDITTQASNVIFRPDGSTTFDYIGWVVGDPVSWDEWEARQNKPIQGVKVFTRDGTDITTAGGL